MGHVYRESPLRCAVHNSCIRKMVTNDRRLMIAWLARGALANTPPRGAGKDGEYFDFLEQWPISNVCGTSLVTYGGAPLREGDPPKRVCESSAGLHENKCWVLSIGSRGDFAYESDIVARTRCSVQIFDCTGNWSLPPSIASRAHFHSICLGPRSESVRSADTQMLQAFLSWSDLLRHVAATARSRGGLRQSFQPALVKMDVEGFEFSSLGAMLDARHIVGPRGVPFGLPSQIAWEMHMVTYLDPGPPWQKMRQRTHRTRAPWWQVPKVNASALVRRLVVEGGYRFVSRLDSKLCPHCTELVMVRQDGGG